MQKSERHLNHWDVRIVRDYVPFYFLGSNDRYDSEPTPPVQVQISAEFDSDEAALTFEYAVRQLLENL